MCNNTYILFRTAHFVCLLIVAEVLRAFNETGELNLNIDLVCAVSEDFWLIQLYVNNGCCHCALQMMITHKWLSKGRWRK
jgi:hypothetical protein